MVWRSGRTWVDDGQKERPRRTRGEGKTRGRGDGGDGMHGTGMSGMTLRITLSLIMFNMFCISKTYSQLIGTVAECDLPDGNIVDIAGISDNPCITCICLGGKVECSKETCPSLEGCHVILYDKPKSQCCNKCRGCDYRGQYYESGAVWTDKHKPCKRYSCTAGVVTLYRAVCHVPCKHPLVFKGQCCPVCEGCSLNGVDYKEGEVFPSFKDPCSTCTCQNGTIECTRRACPVLNCPENYVTVSPGSCCPVCTKTRQLFELRKRWCLFRTKIYANGSQIRPDSCTDCQCLHGTMVCQKQVCPLLKCELKEVDPLTCCAKCKEKVKNCRFRGKSHKHGSTWWLDECTSCNCDNATVRCHVQQCPNHVECQRGQRLSHVRGKCCPVCVENDAVCAVFGDPHYRTFDGRIYNFQGTCRFILAEDCTTNNFSVRVRNDARLTNDFAWTKSVSVLLPSNLRIALRQNLKIKVNGKSTSLPFVNKHVAIVKGGDSITLKTRFGLKVIWDGDSYLEVSVPSVYKRHMCGLCGNYNGIQADDFLGKNGALYLDANEFAESWRLGRSTRCGRRKNKTLRSSKHELCSGNKRRLRRAEEECSVMLGPPFTACRKTVDAEPYYRSCIVDVCDCPSHKRCSCEAIIAFSRQCARDGIQVKPWRTPSVCGAAPCPRGARYNICASACPRTCQNQHLPAHCDQPCVKACQCPPNKVLQGNRCIKPTRCKTSSSPSSSSRRKQRLSKAKNLLSFS